MNKITQNQSGFSVLMVVIPLLAIIVVGAVGYSVANRSNIDTETPNQTSNQKASSKDAPVKLELQNYGLAGITTMDYNPNAFRDFQSMA